MHNNRRFALSALAFAVALALVSCKPLQGHAANIDVGEQTGIYDYLDTGAQNLQQIDFSLDSDEDGNRSVRLKIYGLQKLALSEQTNFYDNLDFGAAPDSVTISGGGGVGFYRHNQNSDPLPATVLSCRPGEIMAQSDEFSITVRYGIESMNSDCVPYSDNVKAGYKYTGSGYYSSVIYHDSMGFLTDVSQSYNIFTNDIRAYTFSQNGIPVVTSGTRCDLVSFGSGTSLTLPPGTVDSSRPWDYYNNVLLPYMEEEFPGYDQYFVFPDGYQPPAQPSTVPVEYPTLPGFDLALETNGTQPASDYAYNIPELPTKDIAVPAFDFSSIDPVAVMAPVAENLRSMWALVTGILTEYNLFPYVAIAVFAAIVAGLMHLGK